jgi:exosortase D (VPLPA-CTERM-specific)
MSMKSIAMIALCLAFLGTAYASALTEMVKVWLTSEEYSHGILIPFVAAFLVWQLRSTWQATIWQGSWLGCALVVVALLLNLLGKLSAILVLQQYAFVFTIWGLVLALAGRRVVAILWAPLLILLFMVPPPNFFMNNLSAQLQLWSSHFGVSMMRMFGVSVFLEGNVVDLGSYKLQVAEACSGLRYLFPLLTLGFIMSYLFKAELWKRALLFVSSIPITIVMNSLRIGMIGIAVEQWGQGMAEGFLHDFEGWMVFMCSAGVLVLEMMFLARIGKRRRTWRELFGIDVGPSSNVPAPLTMSRTAPFSLGLACIGVMSLASVLMPERVEAKPQRDAFVGFPDRIGEWSGRRESVEKVFLDVLKLDDYITSNYSAAGGTVNLYIAWYDSQRSGQSAHSPRSCLPGGGWRIEDLSAKRIEGVAVATTPLIVNRALIRNGDQRQLVYYWFQQRGRVVTNEYLVKWYLFWDSLTRNRTDGALVRLVTPIHAGTSVENAEARMIEFVAAAATELPRFVPN